MIYFILFFLERRVMYNVMYEYISYVHTQLTHMYIEPPPGRTYTCTVYCTVLYICSLHNSYIHMHILFYFFMFFIFFIFVIFVNFFYFLFFLRF